MPTITLGRKQHLRRNPTRSLIRFFTRLHRRITAHIAFCQGQSAAENPAARKYVELGGDRFVAVVAGFLGLAEAGDVAVDPAFGAERERSAGSSRGHAAAHVLGPR